MLFSREEMLLTKLFSRKEESIGRVFRKKKENKDRLVLVTFSAQLAKLYAICQKSDKPISRSAEENI